MRGRRLGIARLVVFSGFEMFQGDAELVEVAEPLLLLRPVDPLVQVLFDAVQAPGLVGTDMEVVATDAGVFVAAAGAVGADTVTELDAAPAEVFGELL